jgi:tetratricopeptide (TPR) repeat protein
VLKLRDHVDAAIEQYQRSRAIFERLGSLYATGVLHMNLGSTYTLRGDLQAAETNLSRAAELFNQAGAEDFLPELERYIAELHILRGDLPKARLACELSLTNAARLEARAEEGMARRTLAQIKMIDGDPSGAWEELALSLAILNEAASPHEIARTLLAMAGVAPALDRHADGQDAIDEALPILRDVGAQRDLEEARAITRRYGYTSPAAADNNTR